MHGRGLSHLRHAAGRALGLIALAGLVFGAGLPQGEAAAAPPSTNYYQVAIGTKIGNTISGLGDSMSGASTCTLRDALGAANFGATSGAYSGCAITQVGSGGPYVIRLPKSAYTYTLTVGELPITNASVFVVGSKPSSSIIQASTCDPITLPNGCTPATNRILMLSLQPSNSVVFENLTLRYGRCAGACGFTTREGGAFYQNGGAVTLRNVVATHNQADDGAGNGIAGAAEVFQGTLTVTGKSVFSGNRAANTGGAIFMNFNGSVVIDGSTLVDNEAMNGGAIASESAGNVLRIIHKSTISRSKNNTDPSATYGGGLYLYGGDTVVDGSTLTNLAAGSQGGAFYMDGNAMVTIQAKSMVSLNTAVDGAGVFANQATGGTVTVDNSTFKGNHAASQGGAAYIDHAVSHIIIRNKSIITGNISDGSGGGLQIEGGTALITGLSQLTKNTSVTGGGGIASTSGTITINSGSLVSGNVTSPTTGFGGGLEGTGGSTFYLLDGITISKNSAEYAGGIYGSFTATNVLITGNVAKVAGGGFMSWGDTHLTSSTVSGNSATTGGGGDANGNTWITGVTFSGNKANGDVGGGLASGNTANVRVNNSTFTGNSANSGGGIANGGPLKLYNVTITGNTAVNFGAGVHAILGGVTAQYQNSIISLNTAPLWPDCANVQVGSSQGYNIAGNACDVTGTGDQSGVDPKLSKPAKNGGPTLTELPMTGSPAIDAGNPTGCQGDTGGGLAALASDQRGYLRSFGAACDIGAVEVQLGPAALTSPKTGVVLSTLKFSWKNAPGASMSKMAASHNPDCSGVGFSESSQPAKSSATFGPDIYGWYYWCVQDTLPGPVPLATSEIRSFEYTFAKTPLNNAYYKQGKVKFSWLKLADPSNSQPATGYDLSIGTSSTCATSDVASMPGLTATSVTVTLAPGALYWKVTTHFPASGDAVSTCRSLTITY